MDSDALRKARGAFFTPREIAHYLVNWAVRSPRDTVFEPSCGEAIFLVAAANRLKTIGADTNLSANQLHGVEIFESSAETAELLLRDAGFDSRIIRGDFLDHQSADTYDAVVGNPPFIRYQNFTGRARARGLEAALAQGVRLSGLASSWAAFVLKSALHVAPNGRLALVLPAELLSVKYAQEVRRFLLRRFRRVRLIVFEERVFPGVLEEVVLLLAEGNGGADCLEVHQARDLNSLESVEAAKWKAHAPGDSEKWTQALVAQDAFATYLALTDERFEQAADWGGAYLGAVTGNNSYFSLTAAAAERWGLTEDDTIRISPPGSRHLRGLSFTTAHWKRLASSGARCLLLYPTDKLSDAGREYLAKGERAGVSKAYKCRVRSPWWRVPLVQVPDLVLPYMNHDRPRLISNKAKVQILNSVYGIRLPFGRKRVGRDLLPVACLNSVTLLGTEIVGRAYGGGLLKMEPREADKLPLPALDRVRTMEKELRLIKPKIARHLRSGSVSDAVEAVDKVVLRRVPESDLKSLRLAREILFQRRRTRGRSGY